MDIFCPTLNFFRIGNIKSPKTADDKKPIIIAKIAKILENLGATDKWFEETCMNVDFFKNLHRHTIEHEKSYEKHNKKEQSEKKEKNTEVSNIATSQNRLIA